MSDEVERTKKKVWSWLVKSNFQPLEESQPGMLWVIQADSQSGPGIYTMQVGHDELIVGSSFATTDQQRREWAKLPPGERNRLRWKLQEKLLECGSEFEIRGELEVFMFNERIFFDGLTKNHFWQRVRAARNAAMRIGTFIAMTLGEPLPEQDSFVN
jgi:hypothetical protein